MARLPELETERLRLRAWRPADREPFARLNADPRVTEWLGGTLSSEQSDALLARIVAEGDAQGFGLWAVEVMERIPFIGFVGLVIPSFRAHFTPCVEIGWRLAPAAWGHGYATEAARAVLAFAFELREFPEVVSFTAVGNARSRAVMERLGMQRRPDDDFDHPALPAEHPLRRHVLYRLTRVAWIARRELARRPVRFAGTDDPPHGTT